MSQIFDKAKREQAKQREATIYGEVPVLTRDYIRALENTVIASVEFWKHFGNDNLLPFDQLPEPERRLMNALDTVDWMRK
jgi:hypothetical protein